MAPRAPLPIPPSPSFHSQHAPVGAFMSLTCGLTGARGGIGLEKGRPANQDLYVGVKRGDRTSFEPLRCLPFFAGAGGEEAARFLVEQSHTDPNAPNQSVDLQAYRRDEVERHYGWATDRWETPDLTFTLYTPFPALPEPGTGHERELRSALLPAIVGDLLVDNTRGTEPKTAIVALGFNEPGARLLEPLGAARRGFALGRKLGVLAELDEPTDDLFLFSRFSVAEGLRDVARTHRLGPCPGVGVVVPPGQRRVVRLAFGAFVGEIATTGLEARYLYTQHYASLEEVLDEALSQYASLTHQAQEHDRHLATSGLSAAQAFLVAHATRSYHGSTQLLEVDREPVWVVNEGEYTMINTLDLSVDQVFFELDRNPWVVRSVLEGFAERYAYDDGLGVSFAHDQGVQNAFTPFGTSSYELPELDGCFSYMTQEELCNWVLIAATYYARTQDARWLAARRDLCHRCLDSMLARADENGVMVKDSPRCRGGQEITTYDSLDPSLGQARGNLYLAVKCWATYLALATLEVAPERSLAAARRLATAIVEQRTPDGTLPAVFEPASPGYASRILPAIEALVYPHYWAAQGHPEAAAWISATGPFGELLGVLRDHTLALLNDPERRNLFPDGGLRLSSTSQNSWMSKIAIFQHVARRVLALDTDPAIRALLADADIAHVGWQVNGSAYWACSDQFVSGEAQGSRYYPRCVTTCLWLP